MLGSKWDPSMKESAMETTLCKDASVFRDQAICASSES